jgi:hypothetical protein
MKCTGDKHHYMAKDMELEYNKCLVFQEQIDGMQITTLNSVRAA